MPGSPLSKRVHRQINGRFQFDRDKTVYINHYYFYIDDADFGPPFIKVCSYAPWSTKLCLNRHEWAKRQLEKKKIDYEALDNGFLTTAGRSPGCSRGWRPACFAPRWRCSRPTMPFSRSRCVKPWTAPTRNSICLSTRLSRFRKPVENLTLLDRSQLH